MSFAPDRLIALVLLVPILAFTLLRTALYAAHALRQGGPPRDEEMLRRGQSFILAQPLRQWFAFVTRPLVEVLAAVSTPDLLSVLCLTLSVVAGGLIAGGMLATGAVVGLLGTSLDYFDGRVAREHGRATPAGSFLDSTFDRWSEVALLTGSALLVRDRPVALAACVVALGSSLIVSYARAKAESLGTSLRAGLMRRPERVVVFFGGALAAPFADSVFAGRFGAHAVFRAVLVFLAVATTITAAGRTWRGYRDLRERRSAAPRPAGVGEDVGRPPV
jgi:CDP-diacylglycerol--glycerol-3-phosphate 3-phosphatidyltransferase